MDLSVAERTSFTEIVRDLSTIALRKAELAIEYALAEPELLDMVVSEYVSRGETQAEPLILLLAQIRKLMQSIAYPNSRMTKENILGKTSLVVDAASSVVSECLGKIDRSLDANLTKN